MSNIVHIFIHAADIIILAGVYVHMHVIIQHSKCMQLTVQEQQSASTFAILFHDEERAVVDFEAEDVRAADGSDVEITKAEPIEECTGIAFKAEEIADAQVNM